MRRYDVGHAPSRDEFAGRDFDLVEGRIGSTRSQQPEIQFAGVYIGDRSCRRIGTWTRVHDTHMAATG